MHFKVVLEGDEEVGGYVVSCPGLPGCFSQGDSIEEAIQACLESLTEDEIESCFTQPNVSVCS